MAFQLLVCLGCTNAVKMGQIEWKLLYCANMCDVQKEAVPNQAEVVAQ